MFLSVLTSFLQNFGENSDRLGLVLSTVGIRRQVSDADYGDWRVNGGIL